MYLPTEGSLVSKCSILDNISLNTKLTKQWNPERCRTHPSAENVALTIKIITIAIIFVRVYPWI